MKSTVASLLISSIMLLSFGVDAVKAQGDEKQAMEKSSAPVSKGVAQVEIETRFIEVVQDDRKEADMEWLLGDNRETIGDEGVSDHSTTGTMARLLTCTRILTESELMLILHALEQCDGVNLLSAPKVTTKSGSNAEIKVVREIIYPAGLKVETLVSGTSSSSNQFAGAVVMPKFETRDVGVILNVTPVVQPDGYTIDLTLLPQVVELADWMEYRFPLISPNGTIQEFELSQPVFHSRSIATSISVRDGQTVVMGGLITEDQRVTEDKIPVLGHIPLLGRLFRSKTSKNVKRHLIILVTARLVGTAGK